MAGSITWREYESDHLTKYSIKVDESNANLYSGTTGQILCKVRDSNWKPAPKTLILRRVHCISQLNNSIKRSFIVGNRKFLDNQLLEIGEEYIANGTGVWSWIITGYTGEKYTNPIYLNQLPDTGLNDGTIQE